MVDKVQAISFLTFSISGKHKRSQPILVSGTPQKLQPYRNSCPNWVIRLWSIHSFAWTCKNADRSNWCIAEAKLKPLSRWLQAQSATLKSESLPGSDGSWVFSDHCACFAFCYIFPFSVLFLNRFLVISFSFSFSSLSIEKIVGPLLDWLLARKRLPTQIVFTLTR